MKGKFYILLLLFPIAILSENIQLKSKISYLHIVSQIQSRFAVTQITSEVVNLVDAAKEVFFTAQLPDAAFISNFSMLIGNITIFGDVKEKEKAKEIYAQAVRRGQSAGLVAEKPRETNSFDISVNVAANDKVIFNLTYQELLKRTHGVYKHVINLQPQQTVEDCQIDVLINEQGLIKELKVPKFGPKIGEKSNKELLELTEQEVVKTTSAFTKDSSFAYITYKPAKSSNGTVSGQLVVLYDVERDNTGGHIEVMNGYFVHFFAPNGLERGRKNVIFILDKSGSMSGRKFTQTKDAMKTILKELDKNDKFNILMFSDRTEQWKPQSVNVTEDIVKEAVQYVDDTEAKGGTNIYDALSQGLSLLTTSEQDSLTSMIIFLTDGEATVGVVNNDVIVNNISALNQNTNYVIHSLAFGNNADFKLVQRISSRNKGLARKVYEDSDADLQLTGFYGEISSPLLTNVNIQYLNETVDVDSLVQDNSYNYYDGGEFVVVGKLNDLVAPNPYFNAEVSAKAQSGPVSFRTESKDIICPRGFAVIEGDIMITCCIRGEKCPPTRPFPQSKPTPPLLPASTIGGFVERMWAYQTIKKLIKSSDLEAENQEKNRRKALELSLQYKFVTQLTSMVVVQPDKENATVLEESSESQEHFVHERSHGNYHLHGPSGSGGMWRSSAPGNVQNAYVDAKRMMPTARPTQTTTAAIASAATLSTANCKVAALTIFIDMTSTKSQCEKNYEYYENILKEDVRNMEIYTYYITRDGFLYSNSSTPNANLTKDSLIAKCQNQSHIELISMSNLTNSDVLEYQLVLAKDGKNSLLFITGDLTVDELSENRIKNFRTRGGKIFVFVKWSTLNDNIWKNIAGDDEHFFDKNIQPFNLISKIKNCV